MQQLMDLAEVENQRSEERIMARMVEFELELTSQMTSKVAAIDEAKTSLVTLVSRMADLNNKTVALLGAANPGTSNTLIGNARLRIVGGTQCRGRLEVFHEGSWGTVCDDEFYDVDARAVCKAMGLPFAHAYDIHGFGGGTGPILLDNVGCIDHLDTWSCSHRGWGVHDCTHAQDVGVHCA
eukprot:GHVO01016400.1.p1 GENE.GHVO01016400.1~~GHVO01016400.1.p1  ORF type:complete len:181 (+),score=13.74 GHVO01016400.1:1-543(+)